MSSGDVELSNARWHDVCAVGELDAEFPLGVDIEGQRVGVFKVGEDVHALEDICPHAYALLSQGYQDKGQIECPLHGALFEIASGKSLNDIGQRDLSCHRVKLEHGRVFIQLTPS